MHTSRSNRPTVLVTMGDPAGIGPEVVLKAVSNRRISRLAEYLIIGDGYVLDRTKSRLGIKAKIDLIDLANVSRRDFHPGKTSPHMGRASIEYIDRALELIGKGSSKRLVTGPINKHSVTLAGFSGFQGHTEYLAAKTGTSDFGMMLVGERLKVSLVTRHIALSDVASSITVESVYRAIVLTYESLKKDFGIARPRIGVAGLNPHAGDDGLFGAEETRAIIPAIKKAAAKAKVKDICGPLAPDAVFYDALNGKFDAVIAMYHDQGLAPFKTLYFRSGVNLTLGLPFIRTSPDHGTALDIAACGRADASSMIEAIALACRLRPPCSRKAS